MVSVRIDGYERSAEPGVQAVWKLPESTPGEEAKSVGWLLIRSAGGLCGAGTCAVQSQWPRRGPEGSIKGTEPLVCGTLGLKGLSRARPATRVTTLDSYSTL
mmetsp:Transcript_20560/g.52311  ORF Transcript_20560/g.52311 Transcript_20560/m.52311 type:complete len:102 (+) Transcript_20560:1321-1626(+)